MIALLIVLGVVFLLAILPVGLRLVVDEKGELSIYYTVLWFSILSKPKEDSLTKKVVRKVYRDTLQAGDVPSFGRYLLLVCELLGRALRHAHIRDLTVHAIVGGKEPELNYGKAWAVLGAVMPILDYYLRIKKRDVRAIISEEEDSVRFYLRAHGVLPLFRVIKLLLFTLKGSFKIEYNRLQSNQKTVKAVRTND